MQQRVLVVQDDASLLEFLVYLLTDEGYICESASSLEQAIGQLVSKRFDVVITECLGSRQRNVLDHNAMLAMREACPGIPIILVSTWLADMKQAELSGLFHDVIPMPLDIRELSARLAKALAPPTPTGRPPGLTEKSEVGYNSKRKADSPGDRSSAGQPSMPT